MKMIEWVENKKRKNSEEKIFGFDKKSIDSVLKFHKSLPNYEKTPLINLKGLAKYCGVKNIWLKDESKRFGLNAFKVLGASYAIGKYLSEILNEDISNLPFSVLISEEIKEKLGNLTFITATDGNHGRGVAWVAKYLQQNSIVYMPKGSSQMRLKAIQNEGAEASITNLNYDDTVRLANKKAKENNWIMIQDTAWREYEKIPLWIMQGYSTIMNEIMEELEKTKEKPTHIFLQAGVGSFAGAMQALVVEKFGTESPTTIICEPNTANCIYKSFKENTGNPCNVTGDLKTIMAGLACGEPNTISWEILRDYSNFALSCDDSISAKGMRVLSSPVVQDKRIISGESGAVGIGAFITLCENQNVYSHLWKKLNINSESCILCISTEGDTDKIGYRNIVWNGWYKND